MIPFCISICVLKIAPAGILRLMLLHTIYIMKTAALSIFLKDDAYIKAVLIFKLWIWNQYYSRYETHGLSNASLTVLTEMWPLNHVSVMMQNCFRLEILFSFAFLSFAPMFKCWFPPSARRYYTMQTSLRGHLADLSEIYWINTETASWTAKHFSLHAQPLS